MEKLKPYLQPLSQPTLASAALLILRLVAGAAFAIHGWGKIKTPFSWVPPDAPMAIPAVFQGLAALSEFGGGLAWILGLLTPLASLGMACTMAVAVYLHAVVFGDPFINPTGGGAYELPLLFFAISLVLLTVGPGKFSVDAKAFGERK
ncbi:MAG: DoxX family protein [Bdellovibrionota bacterium]